MIAGETESILAGHYDGLDIYDDGYDNLFGFLKRDKAKRGARKEEKKVKKEARQEKRKEFFSNLGDKVKENGGIGGIGQSVANVVGLFKGGGGDSAPGDGYQVSVGADVKDSTGKVPVSTYLIAGAVAVGLLVLGISQAKKKGRQ